MNTHRNIRQTMFFLVVFLASFTLLFFILKPFFTVLFLGVTGAVVLYPWYERIYSYTKGRGSLSALITVIITVLFVGIPLWFIGDRAFGEAMSLYDTLSHNNVSEVSYVRNLIEKPIQSILPTFSLELEVYIKDGLSFITNSLTDIVFGTATIVLDSFLVLIALFFFLRDGTYFLAKIRELSPLSENEDSELLTHIQHTLTAMIKGSLNIALIQGFLVGLGLFIFNVPNPVLWGSVAAMSAFVPGLGTALVIIPAVIYLFFIGNIPFALGLSVWGGLLVGMIDNILSPYMFKKGTQLHPILILFSIFGGITLFGPEGLLVGPVVASICVALLRVYNKTAITHG